MSPSVFLRGSPLLTEWTLSFSGNNFNKTTTALGEECPLGDEYAKQTISIANNVEGRTRTDMTATKNSRRQYLDVPEFWG